MIMINLSLFFLAINEKGKKFSIKVKNCSRKYKKLKYSTPVVDK